MMRGKNLGRRVYVRRRGPCPAVWLTLATMATLMAFVFFARPVIRSLSVDLNQAPASAQRVTQDVRFESMETHLVALTRLSDPAQARVEAARYVPRGAAGYVLADGAGYAVVGNGYENLAQARSVAEGLKTEESIAAEVLSRGAKEVLLRVTATQEQLGALVAGETLSRTLCRELAGYALSLDRGERQAPVLRAALSLSAAEARRAAEALAKAAGDAPNPVAAGVVELLGRLADDCQALSEQSQDTPLSFSSKLKYAAISAQIAHLDFLNSLAG